MHIQKARKGFAAPLGIGNTASRPFLLFFGGKGRGCKHKGTPRVHQLRHTAPPRTAAEQSLPGHFQTLRTGEDRAAHGGAGPSRSAAPLRLLHNRGRSGCSGFAPGRAARGSYRLTQARLPPRARRRTAARSHPAARSDASRRARHRRAPMSAAPRGPPRPRRSVPTSSPASVAHPRCGPAGCAPPFPLPRSLPPAAAPRPSDGGGGKPRRAAPPPQPRRAAPRPRPPPRCPPRTHLPRGRRARQEGTAWSESPCHEAGLRRAASIGAATAVRSARGCKRTWEPRDAVTRGAARGPRREGVGATGPGQRRGSVRTGAAALR